MIVNTYKGFTLFRDIEEKRLRVANQGVMLANIYEDHLVGNLVSKVGAKVILGYFLQIPEDERKEVRDNFERIMKERGFLEINNG